MDLIESASIGDYEGCKRFVDEHYIVNKTYHYGETALFCAILTCYPLIVELLTKGKTDVNYRKIIDVHP